MRFVTLTVCSVALISVTLGAEPEIIEDRSQNIHSKAQMKAAAAVRIGEWKGDFIIGRDTTESTGDIPKKSGTCSVRSEWKLGNTAFVEEWETKLPFGVYHRLLVSMWDQKKNQFYARGFTNDGLSDLAWLEIDKDGTIIHHRETPDKLGLMKVVDIVKKNERTVTGYTKQGKVLWVDKFRRIKNAVDKVEKGEAKSGTVVK